MREVACKIGENRKRGPVALRLRSPLQHMDLADRNLCDVLGENDPARRNAAIGEISSEEVQSHESGHCSWRGFPRL